MKTERNISKKSVLLSVLLFIKYSFKNITFFYIYADINKDK